MAISASSKVWGSAFLAVLKVMARRMQLDLSIGRRIIEIWQKRRTLRKNIKSLRENWTKGKNHTKSWTWNLLFVYYYSGSW